MKSLLAKIGLPKAIGVYVDEGSVTLSQVVSTPLGPIETARRSEIAQPEDFPAVFRRMTSALTGGGRLRHVPVAIGLSTGRTYFATRPIQNPSSEVSPHVLLREALRSPNVSINEMAVDVVKAQPDRRPVASIVSCNKKYLRGLLKALEACGLRPLRVEPAPCAILRVAARRHRGSRHAKVVLRLFLGEARGLAVLIVGGLPVVWRLTSLRRGDEASAILSAARSLTAVSRDCGIESPLDAVMLHGRFDLFRLLDVEWIQAQMGVPMQWYPDPPLDGAHMAFGLALGCFNHDERAFDLSHSLKPRLSLWGLLPWREAALQVGLVLGMALFLADRYRTLNDSYVACQAHNTHHAWMESLTEQQIEQERQDLKQKVAALRKFLGSRVTWTSHQRALAACIPDNVALTSFQGASELESGQKTGGQGKPAKSLVLRGAAVIPENGLVPHEIDRFLDTLRAHPSLTRDFPVVELGDLKQLAGTHGEAPLASFTVVCSPKAQQGAAE